MGGRSAMLFQGPSDEQLAAERKRRRVILVLLVAIAAGGAWWLFSSGGGGVALPAMITSAQTQFESVIQKMREDWKEADRARNGFRMDGVAGQVKAWKEGIRKTPPEADGWYCEVAGVSSGGSLTCLHGGVTYHVHLKEPSPAYMATLAAGAKIRLSGKIVEESSWTVSGALDKPELLIEEASVRNW
jgi:hypothetical protein